MSEATIVSATVAIGSTVGLHARPAAILAQAAAAQPAVVTITKGEKSADCRSLLSLLGLGAEHGDEVELKAEGEGAAESVAALAELIATNLDEE